jgi:hypothetical protein
MTTATQNRHAPPCVDGVRLALESWHDARLIDQRRRVMAMFEKDVAELVDLVTRAHDWLVRHWPDGGATRRRTRNIAGGSSGIRTGMTCWAGRWWC